MKISSVNKRAATSSVLAIAVASLSSITPTIASAQEDTEAETASGSNVIMVTARKREENLLEVPLAITAMGTEEISQRGITSVNDLVESTPGINVSNVSSGRNDRSFQQISLRGFTPSTTSSTLTASFIDGVPVASATALNAVIDPERIEILRGPQNAYFGRNAFAGAINIVTREPADYFSGSVSAQWSERNGYDISASVEGPIAEDIVSFRISGRSYGQDGAYKNTFNPNETLGDQSTQSLTGQLVFTPNPDLTIRLLGMYSEDDDGPSADAIISAYELRSVDGAVNIPYLSGSSAGDLVLPSQSNCTLAGRPFICGKVPEYNAAFTPGANTIENPLLASVLANGDQRIVLPEDGVQGYGLVRQYIHAHIGVDYDIGDSGFTLSTLLGYNDEYYSQLDDFTSYDSSAFTGAGAAFGGEPTWSFPFMVERANKDYSGEVRLSYDNLESVQAMLGASYLMAKTRSDLVNIFSETQFLAPRSGTSLSAPGQSETWGVFGSFSYDITEALNISLEGRFQRDTISAIAGGSGIVIDDDNAYGLPPGSYAYDETFLTESYDHFLPRAIISYDVTPDVMVYASWSKAANVSISSFNTQFLQGTPEQRAAAETIGLEVVLEPETLDNYEVGLKGEFLDGRLRASVAAYHAIWKNQYNNRSVVFFDDSEVPPIPVIVTGVGNSGETVLEGVELDLWAEPVDGLTFTFSGSMNDSSIRTFSDPAITQSTGLVGDDFVGNQLPLTSRFSANGGVMYTGDINAWDDGSFFLRADMNWKSKQFVDAGNVTWIGDKATINTRAGFSRDGYSLEAFVTNVLDDDNYASVAQQALMDPSFALSGASYGYIYVALAEPRTFGLRASYEF